MTNPLKEESQNHDEDCDIEQRKRTIIKDWIEWLEEQREERGEY